MYNMGRTLAAFLVASFCPVGFAGGPKGAQSSAEARQLPEWRLKHLTVFQEPDFCTSENPERSSSVRFLWLRTFHHPVVIKATLRDDGTGTVVSKISSGAGGYEPGKVTSSEKRDLPVQDVQDLLTELKKIDFWNMLTTEKEKNAIGEDGAEWMLEVRERNKCHVVNRWSPESGSYREFCLYLVQHLSGLKIPKREIY